MVVDHEIKKDKIVYNILIEKLVTRSTDSSAKSENSSYAKWNNGISPN